MRRVVLVLMLVLGVVCLPIVVSCSRKLTEEDCNHLLGRGVGLAAYAGSAEVPVDIEALKKRARRDTKRAAEGFDQACIGADDGGQIACARRAKDVNEFIGCGGLVQKAAEAGSVVQLVIAKIHSADECSKYAEHAIHIGVGTVDDAGKLARECDTPMEVGVYRCRLAANDRAAWDACDAP